MKPSLKLSIAVLVLTVPGVISEADALDEQLSFVPWTGGMWKSEWPGVEQRTYFYQWSHDLLTWHYAPFMAFGTDGHEFFMESSPSKLFVRLHRHDDPSLTTLQQAKNADFDGDSLSNWGEVFSEGTLSFVWDTDGNLIPDGLEVLLGSLPLINSAAGDDDSNGLNNAEEYLSGRDRGVADPFTDASARQLDVFNLSPF
jgi:hypothetical protein